MTPPPMAPPPMAPPPAPPTPSPSPELEDPNRSNLLEQIRKGKKLKSAKERAAAEQSKTAAEQSKTATEPFPALKEAMAARRMAIADPEEGDDDAWTGGRKTRSKKHSKTHKKLPWSGWSKEAPKGAARTRMYRKCGSKCFLGKKKPGMKTPDFPICKKNTCKISSKGVYAAYVRARQWGSKKSHYKSDNQPKLRRKTYKNVANKAKKILRKKGFHVGKSR